MYKTILITGNRKGIGRFLTEHYLSIGYYVIGCSRNSSDLQHASYFHVECDVSDEKSVKSAITLIVKKFKKIDILLNNAGIASLNHSLLTPGFIVKKVFETNFNGTFYFSREVSKSMMKNGGGKIVNFSSVAVPLNLEGEMVYASSKAAIEKLTKIMSRELAEYNIQINAIGPNPVETDLIKVIPKEKLDNLISRQAINKLSTFDDILNIIDFFISEKSSMVTGQIIYLGGVC